MDSRLRTILLDEAGMPRFDQSDPTGVAEADFEVTVTRVLARLYPSCDVIKFKPLVRHNGEGWRPDIALIDRNWTHWFVIEVETATHSLEKHVVPQVLAFRDGEYGLDTASCIAEGTGLSLERAKTLVQYVPRYVAVVSNRDDITWVTRLAAQNIQFVSIANYCREGSTPALLVTGLLHAAERSIGFGTVLASFQAIRVPRSAFWQEGTYRVAEAGSTGHWDCHVDEQTAWLIKRRGVITLPEASFVQFIEQDDGLVLLRTL